MKRWFSFAILFIVFWDCSSQERIFSLDSVFHIKDEIRFISIIDSLEIKTLSSSKNNRSLIFINDKQLDTVDITIKGYYPVLIDNRIYFNSGLNKSEYGKKIVYSPYNQDISFYQCQFNFDRCLKQFYYTEGNSLYIINPENCIRQEYCTFSEFINKESIENSDEFLGSIHNVFFIDEKTAFVELCILGENDCEGFRYFLVKNGSVNEITKNIAPNLNEKNKDQTFYSKIEFVSKNGLYLREFVKLSGIHSSYDVLRNRLFDNKFIYICDLMIIENFTVKGVNMQNGDIKNYFLLSKLNNRQSVIIPYKFIPELDIAMYKAYNDTLLSKEEIHTLGKYELGILRNLIFAKHNYDFSSEFYQAYFNLYAFYNDPEMRKTRKKDVNNLLTETDKKNLSLIKELESKINVKPNNKSSLQ